MIIYYIIINNFIHIPNLYKCEVLDSKSNLTLRQCRPRQNILLEIDIYIYVFGAVLKEPDVVIDFIALIVWFDRTSCHL